ncbi:PI-PLC X domain-containing protein 1 [Lemmus lemmus]
MQGCCTWICGLRMCRASGRGICTALEGTLSKISEWLESHPHEVIILACRSFEGMTGDLHEYLIDCIKNVFRDLLCLRGVRRRTVGVRVRKAWYLGIGMWPQGEEGLGRWTYPVYWGTRSSRGRHQSSREI